MYRKGRLPVTVKRLGQGAPLVAAKAIWVAYECGWREVAVVVTSQGRTHAWVVKRLNEEEFDWRDEG